MSMLFSNEIVFRGHPDKVADQISDRILMECLKQDKYSRVAVETVGGKEYIVVTGEISTNAKLDVEYLIKDTLRNVGYKTDYEIINDIGIQSKDISQGVDYGGAGDQGMMFGYATNETKEMLPKAVVILQKLSKWYDEVRQVDSRFLPDGKAQITGYYDNNNRLDKIKTFTISYNNTEIDRPETDRMIKDKVIQLANEFDLSIEEILINPTGKFLIGGFEGDAGLTGRKIVVDSYHSFAPVGGGAFSGKDPTKVDRSGAYKARQVAKRVLQEKKLEWCQVQVAYAIGIIKPLSIHITSNEGIVEFSDELYDEFTVKRMIEDLDLVNTNYIDLAAFGHFRN